jgi:hypothetical protein
MDQEAKFRQLAAQREQTDAKMRDDFLLGAAKIEQARIAAEQAADERAARPGSGSWRSLDKPKKPAKRIVRKVSEGVWEMVEEVAAQAAQQAITQNVMKGNDG